MNCVGILTCGFLKNKYLYCLGFAVGSPQMWRGNYMHWSAPFYVGDLSIQRFWCPWVGWAVSWNQSSTGIRRQILRESKLHVDFWLHGGSARVTRVQGSAMWQYNNTTNNVLFKKNLSLFYFSITIYSPYPLSLPAVYYYTLVYFSHNIIYFLSFACVA